MSHSAQCTHICWSVSLLDWKQTPEKKHFVIVVDVIDLINDCSCVCVSVLACIVVVAFFFKKIIRSHSTHSLWMNILNSSVLVRHLLHCFLNCISYSKNNSYLFLNRIKLSLPKTTIATTQHLSTGTSFLPRNKMENLIKVAHINASNFRSPQIQEKWTAQYALE